MGEKRLNSPPSPTLSLFNRLVLVFGTVDLATLTVNTGVVCIP